MSRFRKGSRVPGFQDSSGFNTLEPSTPRILEPFLRGQKGFTAIEAVMIVVILSILTVSAVVSYRLTNQDKATIAADQLIADIQYVQMRAMGIGTSQSITFTTGLGTYTAAGEQKNLPGGVTLSTTATFTFNSLGEPTVGGDGVIQVGSNKYIKVLGITGYVCNCKNSACNVTECLN